MTVIKNVGKSLQMHTMLDNKEERTTQWSVSVFNM